MPQETSEGPTFPPSQVPKEQHYGVSSMCPSLPGFWRSTSGHQVMSWYVAWSLLIILGWLTSEPQGSACLCLPRTGTRNTPPHWAFYIRARYQTQVLMFAWQTLYQLSHPPASLPALHNDFIFVRPNSPSLKHRTNNSGLLERLNSPLYLELLAQSLPDTQWASECWQRLLVLLFLVILN